MGLTKFVPDRRKSLTVATPWGVELNKPRFIGEKLVASLCQHVIKEKLLIKFVWHLLFWFNWNITNIFETLLLGI